MPQVQIADEQAAGIFDQHGCQDERRASALGFQRVKIGKGTLEWGEPPVLLP
jgi:hypothetical protein